MRPIRKKRLWFVLILLASLAGATSLAIYALGQNMNVYFTPTQVVEGALSSSHSARMGGMVKKDSLKRSNTDLDVTFLLTDFQSDVKVNYTGILPSLFREGQGAVVQGKITSDGVFKATQVLAKHDEKYMPPGIRPETQQQVK